MHTIVLISGVRMQAGQNLLGNLLEYFYYGKYFKSYPLQPGERTGSRVALIFLVCSWLWLNIYLGYDHCQFLSR